MPRQRKVPKRIDDSSFEGHVLKTPKDYHRKVYYEVFDQIVCSLKSRFHTDSSKFFKTLESFIVGKPVDMKDIIKFYKKDFDESRLVRDKVMTLDFLKQKGSNATILWDIVQFLRENEWCMGLVPEYLLFICLLLIIPIFFLFYAGLKSTCVQRCCKNVLITLLFYIHTRT